MEDSFMRSWVGFQSVSERKTKESSVDQKPLILHFDITLYIVLIQYNVSTISIMP